MLRSMIKVFSMIIIILLLYIMQIAMIWKTKLRKKTILIKTSKVKLNDP